MTDVAKGQLVLHGLHVWQDGVDEKGQPREFREPTAYPVDWPATLTGKTSIVPFTIEGDKDFMLTHITHAQADTATFIPMKVNVSQQDGRTLFSEACYLNTISNQNAGQPYVLSMKRLFRRTSTNKATFEVDA